MADNAEEPQGAPANAAENNAAPHPLLDNNIEIEFAEDANWQPVAAPLDREDMGYMRRAIREEIIMQQRGRAAVELRLHAEREAQRERQFGERDQLRERQFDEQDDLLERHLEERARLRQRHFEERDALIDQQIVERGRLADGQLEMEDVQMFGERDEEEEAREGVDAAPAAAAAVVNEEMIREASEMREQEESNPSRSRFSRACLICALDNPRKRAVFTQCGHIVCYPCAVDNARMNANGAKCVFCQATSGFIRLFEDEGVEADNSNEAMV